MWIITVNGFVSLVQSRDDESLFLARGRDPEDLLAIFDLESDQVFEDETADYRYRAEIPKDQAMEAIITAMEEIDYETDFKGHADKGSDHRHQIYMEIWGSLYRLQTKRGTAS